MLAIGVFLQNVYMNSCFDGNYRYAHAPTYIELLKQQYHGMRNSYERPDMMNRASLGASST